MKKTILSLIASIAILVSILSVPVIAQMGPDDDFMGPPQGMEPSGPPSGMDNRGKNSQIKHHKKGGGAFLEMMKELNLTDDQKQKLKSQRTAAQGQMKSIRKQLMNEHKKMAEIMFSPNSTKAEMIAQHQKVMAIQNQLAMLRINNISAFKEILTVEQKSKLQKVSEEKMKKFEAKRKDFEGKRKNSSKN